ncbi:MAG: beta-CASP ribonuclease aCPSF1 [Sulfolobales archaeon]|nr:beta-CASP ribonuclease aCPSF1 [Sulfolobales archaeon]MDW7968849.1 beta-CASP ribonuclease aCPSF1 [Sulfolobales archaeon]
MASANKIRQLIVSEILNQIPKEAQVTKIEFEGPEIAVYVRNVNFIIEKENIVKNIAKTIRKRIVVRVDESSRKPEKEAIKYILSAVPPEARLTDDDITFDKVLGEAVITTLEPKYFYQDNRALYKKVFAETGWRPKIVRKPPLKSRILDAALKYLISESDERIGVLRNIGERIHRDILFKDQYVRMTALGGFMEVGRSSILIETSESKVLLDFGFNPNAPDVKSSMPRIDVIGVKPEEIDAVVITHAHLDHCGLVPFLFKYGYRGPVYTTEATRDLMVLLQLDLLDISKREGRPLPFDQKHVHKTLLHTIPLRFNEVTDIAPDIRLTLYDAGHILGSAIAHLHIGNGLHNIVYTSDFKYGRTRLLNKANEEFPRVDTLIMETTYGGSEQPSREEAESKFVEIIKKTVERRGKVLIPTLSVGRAQEVMVIITNAMEQGILPKVPVYIEGMINEVTAIHTAYPELLSKELREKIYSGVNPFISDVFKVLYDRSARHEIVESEEPCIIMATSGMLTGGPAVEYFRLMAPDPKNSLIFVNYQVEGTLGRKVKDGMKEVHMVVEDKLQVVKVGLEVHSIDGFSGHSDHRQLIKYLKNLTSLGLRPKKLIVNHGEPENIKKFISEISRMKSRKEIHEDLEVYYPRVLDSISLII